VKKEENIQEANFLLLMDDILNIPNTFAVMLGTITSTLWKLEFLQDRLFDLNIRRKNGFRVEKFMSSNCPFP